MKIKLFFYFSLLVGKEKKKEKDNFGNYKMIFILLGKRKSRENNN